MSSILLNGRDRQTPRRSVDIIVVPVKAGQLVRAGFIAVVDSTGYAIEGNTATGLTYLGIFDETIDNTAGTDGAAQVRICRQQAFLFDNAAADPVVQANLGKKCFITDASSVSATSGTNTKSEAGIVLAITNEGVWVE